MSGKTYAFGVCSVLALMLGSVGAAASTTVVASKTNVENFLGGKTGKLVYTDKNDSGKVWWIDFGDMTARKLSDDTSCSEPLLSPDGTRVVYGIYSIVSRWEGDASKNNIGNSYVRSLSGGSRVHVGGNAVRSMDAFAPHWWVDPGNGNEYIVYMDHYCKDVQTWSNRHTWKQRIDSSSNPTGNPIKILDHAFDGGLSKDGKWVAEAYRSCYMARTMDLGGGDGWTMTSGLDGGKQCCNASMSPDNNYYIMHLDLAHASCEIRTSSDSLIKEIFKPIGSGEMQNPEYSTDPGYSTFTAKAGTGSSDPYYIYIASTSTGASLLIAEGNFSVPHLWVDTGAAPPNSAPQVGLTRSPSSGVEPLTVNFDANSSDPDGDTLTHEWDWDYSGSFSSNLNSGTDETRSYTYNNPGNYTCAVRVSDGQGHSVIDTVTITVNSSNDPPTVNLTRSPSSGLAPLTVNFDANSNDPDGDTLTHEWDWEYSGSFSSNLNSGTDETRSYTYNNPGNYTCAVRVSDGQGHSIIDTVSITVTANQPPTVNLTASPSSGTAPLTVNFNANSSDPESDPLTHEWDWEYSGSFSSNQNSGNDPTPAAHTYTTPGNYTCAVRVSDDQGHSVIDTLVINVNSPGNNAPVISSYDASPNPAEVGQTVTFDCDASDPDSDPLSYYWSFGDGNNASGATVAHAYSSAGVYTVHVDVTDGRGGGDGQDIVVTVNPPPTGIHMKINCGSNSYDVSGWERDDSYVSGGEDWVNADTVSTAGVPNAAPANVYKSVRHRAGASSYPTFTFPAVANGDYTVRLHFADRYVGPRYINVDIEGVRVFSSYDITSDAGGTNKAVVKSLSVTVSDGDGMTIELGAEDGGDSFIAGMEITSEGGPGVGDPGDKAFDASFVGGGCAPGAGGPGLAGAALCLALFAWSLRGRGRRQS